MSTIHYFVAAGKWDKLRQGCLFVFEQHLVALQYKTLLRHCIIVVIMVSGGHIKLIGNYISTK